jgi:hypothetical protein
MHDNKAETPFLSEVEALLKIAPRAMSGRQGVS